MRAYQLAGEPVVVIGERFEVSGVAAWKTLAAPAAPSPISLPYFPDVYALAGDLAVVVANPEIWNVEAVQARFGVSHAEATRWFQKQRDHLALMGYRMLLLWKNELDGPAVAHILRYRLRVAPGSIGARECEVVVPTPEAANAFYERYHLQGRSNAKIHFGLHRANELVALMSFHDSDVCRGAPGGWLLQRFATSVVVPGAASRLLAAFRKQYRGPVVSYSDERYAPGGAVYSKLGFERVQETVKPDYRYWRDNRWFAKNTKQRKSLIAETGNPDDGSTEFEMAAKLGYLRCYDLGKVTWNLAAEPESVPLPASGAPLSSPPCASSSSSGPPCSL
jgi:hypothetical protein